MVAMILDSDEVETVVVVVVVVVVIADGNIGGGCWLVATVFMNGVEGEIIALETVMIGDG